MMTAALRSSRKITTMLRAHFPHLRYRQFQFRLPVWSWSCAERYSAMKKPILIVATAVLLFGGMLKTDFDKNPKTDGYQIHASVSDAVPNSDTKESNEAPIEIVLDGSVYITPSGKRWHIEKSCAGESAEQVTKEEAEGRGLTPCKKCAGG